MKQQETKQVITHNSCKAELWENWKGHLLLKIGGFITLFIWSLICIPMFQMILDSLTTESVWNPIDIFSVFFIFLFGLLLLLILCVWGLCVLLPVWIVLDAFCIQSDRFVVEEDRLLYKTVETVRKRRRRGAVYVEEKVFYLERAGRYKIDTCRRDQTAFELCKSDDLFYTVRFLYAKSKPKLLYSQRFYRYEE